ncbi:hypothetical protein AB0J21_29530 [Streptomyces sp. NPDC049954]|uniref:hypothetical protein n=1 Tax=Streptomyces sp. NPDC049954 TaxID=3155779 RepID=UPI003430A5E9
MTTRFDDEGEERGEADDPLVRLLRPADVGRLPLPPGQYAAVRRRAGRRRLVRTAGGAALATAAALLIALPFHGNTGSPAPQPQRPLAPAPARTPSSPPSSATPVPAQKPSPGPSAVPSRPVRPSDGEQRTGVPADPPSRAP